MSFLRVLNVNVCSFTECYLKVVILRAAPIRTTEESALPSFYWGLRSIKAA